MKLANPFFYNYLFSKKDLNRVVINKWRYPVLFFLPEYAQTADGYVFRFKTWQGRIFLLKTDRIVSISPKNE